MSACQSPAGSPPFSGGIANITFILASKSASASFFYVPNPSTPAVITAVSPSEVLELGGRTVQLDATNLQIVDSSSSLECFLGTTNAIAEVLDIKYTGTSAAVVVLVPALLPGLVVGTLGPKSNVQNRATFRLSIMSSVPFAVDPFSVFPPVFYQDYAGNVSVRMSGVPSTASISQLLFSISGFSPASSISFDSICTLQFNGATQIFNVTVLPTIPATSLASVSPTFGSSLGGSVITPTASRLKELVQDLDGSHIKGLGINLFQSEWPSLTREEYQRQQQQRRQLRRHPGVVVLVYSNYNIYV